MQLASAGPGRFALVDDFFSRGRREAVGGCCCDWLFGMGTAAEGAGEQAGGHQTNVQGGSKLQRAHTDVCLLPLQNDANVRPYIDQKVR